ncbi:MAG TPA: SRPBCC family protein [Euzebyales bacterium]|nr:SRPBCC family protein [Euzebyales bacterium]
MGIHGYILIRRPPAVVFDFVADERNNYDPSIHDAQLLTGEPIGAGTRFRCTAAGRRPVQMTVEIVEYDRPRRLATVTRLAGMDIATTLRFEPHGKHTRLHWRSSLQPQGFLRVLTPVLGLLGRRRTRAIWGGLQEALETQPQNAAG